MNGIHFPDDPAGVFQSIHLPDFGITWAGANPFGEGFCFGSETGHLAFTDREGKPIQALGQASASGEAVNGVAFSRNWLAVTTRKDVSFIGPWLRNGPQGKGVAVSGGAHEVVVAPSGYFVIPQGRTGIMLVKSGTSEINPIGVGNSDEQTLNFCRVLALPGEKGTDLIVCAGRRGGIGVTHFREETRNLNLNIVKFDALDIVDVCSIATPDKPRAVAAVGREGSLVLFSDILHDKKPQTIKFNSVRGAVYRLLSVRGDIYFLTSHGLFALFQLADRFCQGLSLGSFKTHVLRLAVEGADGNIVDQKWLLVVGVDDLFRFDVQKMPRSPEDTTYADETRSANGTNGMISWEDSSMREELEVVPRWEQTGFEQTLGQVASSV